MKKKFNHRFCAFAFALVLTGTLIAPNTFASEGASLATYENDSDEIAFLQTGCQDPFCRDYEIVFELKRAATVDLIISTPMGSAIKIIPFEQLDAGRHSITWDGRDARGQKVDSGVYIYKLRTEHTEKEITLALLH